MENASVQRGLFFTFRLFSLIRHALRRATLSVGEGDLPAGERSSGAGLNFQGSPPHPARATPGPPSPSRRGLEPLIRHALRRATFPAGEGCLRRGKAKPGGSVPLPSPGGRWLGAAETEEGRYQVRPCTAPHPSRPGALPPSRKERAGTGQSQAPRRCRFRPWLY